jgi:hypothetical protein
MGTGSNSSNALFHADAQLRGDDLLGLHGGERLDLILQARERLHVLGRDQVRAAGEELTELDERGSEALEVGGELLRGAAAFRLRAPLRRRRSCRGRRRAVRART